jgi:pilus assembly protein Flp/PilA
MSVLIARFVKDESGATAIEYGLIAAGISVAIIAVVQGLALQLLYRKGSESMGDHDSEIVDAGSVD